MGKTEIGYFQKWLRSPSNFGLFFRVTLFSITMGAWLGVAHLLVTFLGITPLNFGDLLVAFLAASLPMAASVVLSERPAGEDCIMLRLALATFCRTGLPIICVIAITLVSKKQVQPNMLGCLVFFYILGILTVVWISVYRLSAAKAGSGKNDEVDRAPFN